MIYTGRVRAKSLRFGRRNFASAIAPSQDETMTSTIRAASE